MYILKKAYDEINELYIAPEVRGSIHYRKNQYVYSMKKHDKTYLYHVMTGELIVLDKTETMNAFKDYMVKHWFLVPEDYCEYESAKEFKQYLRKKVKLPARWNNYSIFTTTQCNARCFYCFEKNVKRESMTEEVADKLINFMMQNKADQPMYLTWFGGEPLINVNIIDYICAKLKSLGVEYSSDMHSNGYLFDETTVNKAVDLWNLNIVRITIDGTKEVYKNIKNYISTDVDPFEKVINNIELLMKKGIHVQIRLHLDKYNIDNIEKLIVYLCEKYAHNHLVDIYIHLLFVRHEYNATESNEEERLAFLKRVDELDEMLVKAKVLKYNLREAPLVFACRADWDNVIDVLPNGDLIKCRDYLESKPVGNVLKGNTWNLELVDAWHERLEDFDACKSCVVYPMCARLKMCSEKQVCGRDVVYEKIRKIDSALKYLEVDDE